MDANHNRRSAFVVAVNNAIEHHITIVYRSIFLGETMSLIERKEGWEAAAYDQSFEGLALTDFLQLFQRQPSVVFIWGDVHHAEVMTQIARQLKKVSPDSKAFAFGRSTTFVPQFFERPPFDAVHISGDREAAIADYLDYLEGARELSDVAGISYAALDNPAQFKRNIGRELPTDQWPLPDLSKLPIEKYKEYVLKAYGDRYSKRVLSNRSERLYLELRVLWRYTRGGSY